MKLQNKLSLMLAGLFSVTIIVLCFMVIRYSTNNMWDEITAAGIAEEQLLIKNFSDDLVNSPSDSSSIAQSSFLQYQIRKYASYAAENTEYVLQMSGTDLYNNSTTDPKIILADASSTQETNDNVMIRYKTIRDKSGVYFIAGAEVQDTIGTYTISVVRDISEQASQIRHTIIFCSSVGLVAIMLCIALGSLIIASAIKPIGKLQRGAAELAAGKYDSRIQLPGKDEISSLAAYFNEMAVAIQQHINNIEATSEERRYLLTAIAHEIKTPVTAITGYSYALTHVKLTKRQTAAAVSAISSQSLRLERLSSKLTQLLSLQEKRIEPEEIHMSTLIENAISVLLPIAEKSGITLSFENDETVIWGDLDLLICLITNLFDNAQKAKATIITIRQRRRVIEISDNGQGIPQDKLEKVMLPFYKADESRSGEGFGIGLSLCKKIADAHHASIQLNSELKHGTTIYITFQ